MKIQPTLYIGESFYDHWRIFKLPMLFYNSNADKVIFLQNVDNVLGEYLKQWHPPLRNHP